MPTELFGLDSDFIFIPAAPDYIYKLKENFYEIF